MNTIKIIPFALVLGLLVSSCNNNPKMALAEPPTDVAFQIPENFILEDLYHPSAHEQGSWVALAEGPDNTIFACDQRGKIYHIKIQEIGALLTQKEVKPLALEIGEAHGLLWAFNSLYVAVNKRWDTEEPLENQNGSGIYRLTDTTKDGELDKVERLLKLEGDGEHGPHSFVLSPDGTEIYFIAGNHTLIPDEVKNNSRLPKNWGEDNLFTPYLDARGHANDIKAPGGWISKFSPDGSKWELIAAGFRNPFDLAFNQDGELFTYDSDMEWDIGMPWYRPTRICHVSSGGEFGWRTGSGKWPDYYPDNLPAVQNMAQGSPTAVLSGARLNFPSSYKNGLFVMDWSFGTVYYIHLKPSGSSYTGKKEEFLSGVPLPLTDMIAGTDGHLYFATGGRGLDSHLYRLRYIGDPATATETPSDPEAENLRALRKSIEQYHSRVSPEGVTLAFKHLDHEDRHIQYASRVALEHQPVAEWLPLFLKETKSEKIIQAAIGLAHQGDKALQSTIIKKLNALDWKSLSSSQQIGLTRAYQLLFIRMGAPQNAERIAIIQKLKPHFPSDQLPLTRELAQLMQFLKAEGTTEILVGLLDAHTKANTANKDQYLSEEVTLRSEQYGQTIRDVLDKMPPSEAIFYGVLLSHADKGWTQSLRETYFSWFFDVLGAKGGRSFKPFMENVRQQSIAYVPEKERAYFEELSGVYAPNTSLTDLPQPIGPGKNYSGEDMGKLLWGGQLNTYKGTVADGERAYQAALCVVCHRIRGEGGATGPDLTQAHTKFGSYDLLFAIYSPNDEISDQYAFTLFHQKDGTKIAGRILSEVGDSITLLPNPFNESYAVKLAKNAIEKRELSPVSPMPPGLLNRLNEQEIIDLFAYLQSGGDGSHEIYTKEKSAN
ncbi:c-type cytochrome [Arenibacter sp. GZD96]|uniref:c-type cytochrome n=1 Tax=Aurantibrevibacter litoralis TaxID=3106030 RepID=UPI002AFF80A0|nr:c-type cytochrome [Arenibacter sp. GZD-96]MEA1786723.1 c-type cytochrome [Arenibacter sp. GZD-96]